jgi:hypothetical protein
MKGISSCILLASIASAGCAPGMPPPGGWEPARPYEPPVARVPLGDLSLSPDTEPPIAWGVAGDDAATQGPMFGVDFSGFGPPDGVIPVGSDGSDAEANTATFRGHVVDLLREGMSLWDVDAREIVPTDFHDVGVTLAGFSPRSGHSLTPREPLAPGWYVFRADLRPVRAFGLPFDFDAAAHEGDVAYARIHIGPEPIWVATSVDCSSPIVLRSEEGCDILPMAGYAPSASPATFTIRYDGTPIDCVPRTSPAVPTTMYLCPTPPRGARVSVQEDGTLGSPSGELRHEMQFDANEVFDAGHAPVVFQAEPEFAMDLVRGAP